MQKRKKWRVLEERSREEWEVGKKEHRKRGLSFLHGQDGGAPTGPGAQGEGTQLPPAAGEFKTGRADRHRKICLPQQALLGQGCVSSVSALPPQ